MIEWMSRSPYRVFGACVLNGVFWVTVYYAWVR